jgi:hypothetical protein
MDKIVVIILVVGILIISGLGLSVLLNYDYYNQDIASFTRECLMQTATKFCNEKMWQNSSTGGTWIVAFANISGEYFGCQAPCGHSGITLFNFSQNEICACNLECAT